jgi:hypothetical protein
MTHGSKNIIGHHQIAATSSGHHQIVATTSTDMAAVVSEVCFWTHSNEVWMFSSK